MPRRQLRVGLLYAKTKKENGVPVVEFHWSDGRRKMVTKVVPELDGKTFVLPEPENPFEK